MYERRNAELNWLNNLTEVNLTAPPPNIDDSTLFFLRGELRIQRVSVFFFDRLMVTFVPNRSLSF